MKIHAFSGSLRKESSNAKLLGVARGILHTHSFTTTDLASLPYFDPDRQFANTPEEVLAFRSEAAGADLILISTPEYAHGIPGILKNALEWLFHEGTSGKPVAVLIGSSQGEFVRSQLHEVLRTMDFAIDDTRFHLITAARAKIGADGMITDPKIRAGLEAFLTGVSK